MNALDGDGGLFGSNGKKCPRDIVQFVPFNKFGGNAQILTQELLREIPNQVTQYFVIIRSYRKWWEGYHSHRSRWECKKWYLQETTKTHLMLSLTSSNDSEIGKYGISFYVFGCQQFQTFLVEIIRPHFIFGTIDHQRDRYVFGRTFIWVNGLVVQIYQCLNPLTLVFSQLEEVFIRILGGLKLRKLHSFRVSSFLCAHRFLYLFRDWFSFSSVLF